VVGLGGELRDAVELDVSAAEEVCKVNDDVLGMKRGGVKECELMAVGWRPKGA
jgi:hypothetical protein